MSAARFQKSHGVNDRRGHYKCHGSSLADANPIYHRFRSTFKPFRARPGGSEIDPTCLPSQVSTHALVVAALAILKGTCGKEDPIFEAIELSSDRRDYLSAILGTLG